MSCDIITELKQQLAREIVESLRGWTPTEAYYAIRLHPSRVSDLRHGRLRRFSTEKLIEILHQLGRTVTVSVAVKAGDGPSSRRQAEAVLPSAVLRQN